MTNIRFGTDGWRAIIAEDYTYDNVARLVQAWCDTQLPIASSQLAVGSAQYPLVVLGYDRRFSSDLFAAHAASVLTANGFKVLLSETYCPTPCVSWMTKKLEAHAGVVITASHNPYQWNGVKFKESYGGSASPAYCQKIETQIQINDQANRKMLKLDLEEAKQKGLLESFSPQVYIEHLRTLIDLKQIQNSKLKIAVDPIFGAGSGFFAEVLGMDVLEIRGEANPGFGGVNPEPIEKNLKALIKTVVTQNCAIGLATDGDADRIGAVDEKGRFIDSHKIFSLILKHLVTKQNRRGDVVTTVSTTQMVSRLCKKFDLPMHETAIGFKYICEKFVALKNPLMGGEESGGLGMAHHVYERDGILSGLLLLDILASAQKPISEIIEELQQEVGPLHFIREDLHCSEQKITELKLKLGTHIPKNIVGEAISQTNFKDGFKFFLADDSWLLVRPSGTEPLLRLYAEAPTKEKALAMIEDAKMWLI